MCRWLAYSGSPVLLEELLYKPTHSLIDQSLHSQLGAETTNGDGFGIGWYGEGDSPALFHSIEPAWNDRNLRELAGHIRSPLVFAHIRASTGTPGAADELPPLPARQRGCGCTTARSATSSSSSATFRRLSTLSCIPEIEGSTDSETFFYLALTLGLEDDPVPAVEDAVGLIEATGRQHGVEHPIQMTVATTDGERLWAFRYSSEGKSRSLFFSTKLETLRALYPDNAQLQGLGDETRLVVSEPLGTLPGAWNEVPESSWGVIQPGQDEIHEFRPTSVSAPVA